MVFFPDGHPLAQALTERDYTDPTAVQTAVLEPGAKDRDLLVSAQTGSGKTVAYGLALASTLLGDAPVLEPAAEPLALIVAPTRELALQVHGELTWLVSAVAGGRVVSVRRRRWIRGPSNGCWRVGRTSWSALQAVCAIIWSGAA